MTPATANTFTLLTALLMTTTHKFAAVLILSLLGLGVMSWQLIIGLPESSVNLEGRQIAGATTEPIGEPPGDPRSGSHEEEQVSRRAIADTLIHLL